MDVSGVRSGIRTEMDVDDDEGKTVSASTLN